MSTVARERLGTLRQNIERGRTLLDWLLALARTQASTIMPSTTVSVRQAYRQVLEDLMSLAEVKGVDIGVVSDLDAHVLVNEVYLITLVKNLVDNAIRYTPWRRACRFVGFGHQWNDHVVVEDSGPRYFRGKTRAGV